MAVIDSMSLWCISIGADDYLTKSADIFLIITLAEEIAVNLTHWAIQMNMKVEEFNYNERSLLNCRKKHKRYFNGFSELLQSRTTTRTNA